MSWSCRLFVGPCGVDGQWFPYVLRRRRQRTLRLEHHMAHRIWCYGPEISAGEELRGARIEADQAIGLRAGLDKPQAIIVVDCHCVRQ